MVAAAVVVVLVVVAVLVVVVVSLLQGPRWHNVLKVDKVSRTMQHTASIITRVMANSFWMVSSDQPSQLPEQGSSRTRNA